MVGFGVNLVAFLNGLDNISFSIRMDVFFQNLLLDYSIVNFLSNSLSCMILFSVSLFVSFLFQETLSLLDILNTPARPFLDSHSWDFNHSVPVSAPFIRYSAFSIENRSKELSLGWNFHPSVLKKVLEDIMCSPRNQLAKD